MELNSTELTLTLPHKTVSFNMAPIYKAESRLQDVSYVNLDSANELSSFFNEACNHGSRFIGAIEFELVHAKKCFALEKARVILDVAPPLAVKLKEVGMKPNDDWREALVARDLECSKWQEAIDMLSVAKSLVSTKVDSFKRAYYSCYKEKDRKQFLPTTHINGHIGETNNVDLVNQKMEADIKAFYGGINV